MGSRHWIGALGLAVLLQASGCVNGYGRSTGVGAGYGSSSAGSATTLDWATSVMGATPKSFVALRIPASGNMRDQFRETHNMIPVLGAAMNLCQQVDIYDDRKMQVLHDVPRWFDPLRPIPPALQTRWVNDGGFVNFVLLSQTPQGIRTYGEKGSDPQPLLMVLPSSTWVIGDPLTLARVALSYARSPGELPRLPAAPGSIDDNFTAAARPPAWVPFADQSTGGGTTIYSYRPGAPVPVAIKVVYRDPRAANAAAEDLRRLSQAHVLQAQVRQSDTALADFMAHIAGIRAEASTLLVESYVTEDSASDLADRSQ